VFAVMKHMNCDVCQVENYLRTSNWLMFDFFGFNSGLIGYTLKKLKIFWPSCHI